MDEETIRRLEDPDCYPGHPESVRVLQTHLSIVCLAGEEVYKIKKAVALPFADYTSLDRREHFCHEEIRLNRRLCPDVYLGVAPLRQQEKRLRFGAGEGEVVDYAVHMRRLPQERMLDELLARDAVSPGDIRELALLIADFHARADCGPEVRAAGDPLHLANFARSNFSETRGLWSGISDPSLHVLLAERAERDFERIVPQLRERAKGGWIVEGHGDLHARNICLSDPVAIYDCIEFSARLRCGDVATENAFLVMDLIYHGHPELARVYVDAYQEASGDSGQETLLPALVRYRAMVRAKVSVLMAHEPEIGPSERLTALASARHHLNFTAALAIAEDRRVLVAACGLPGAGKTFCFDRLASDTGWPCVSTDRVRKELAGVEHLEKLPDGFYTPEFSQRVYDEALRQAGEALSSSPVLLDGNFRSAQLRRQAAELARRASAPLVLIWFATDEATSESRLVARDEEEASLSDASLAVYRKLRAEFEEPSTDEGFSLVKIDGTIGVEFIVSGILAHLLARKDVSAHENAKAP